MEYEILGDGIPIGRFQEMSYRDDAFERYCNDWKHSYTKRES